MKSKNTNANDLYKSFALGGDRVEEPPGNGPYDKSYKPENGIGAGSASPSAD